MARAGWFALQPKAFKSIEKSDFEDLVSDLLHHEWSVRGGSAERERGSRPECVTDGKRDWGLDAGAGASVSEATFKEQFREPPLIADTQKPVVFSAKSGNNWLSLAKKDATRPAAKKTGSKSTKGVAKKGAKKADAGVNRQVHALAAGGRVCIVINVDAPDPAKNRAELARLFLAWPELETTSERALSHRIEIIDANRLQRYLRGVCPLGAFAANWAEKLGVKLPPFHAFERWQQREVKQDRGWPEWSGDDARDRLRASLCSFLRGAEQKPTEERRRWIVGEPGIGKTRLVAEAASLSDETTRRAVYATSDFDRAVRWIEEGGFEEFPSLRLIVDDVDAAQADKLLRRFHLNAPERLDGALIVITPTVEASQQAEVEVTRLERLEASSVVKIINDAAPSLPEQMVSRIEELSAGVPWFAYLVARDVSRETNPKRFGMLDALKVATVGREGDRRSFDVRARCLLLVWLRDGELPPEEADKARLRKSVDLDRTGWNDVQAEIDECVARGIVRRRQDDRFYVSPALLLRELIAWYFGPDGPSGGRITLQSCAPREFERAMQTLPSLGVDAAVVRSFAVAAAQPIALLSSLEQLSDAVADFDALPFVAEHAARELVEALLTVLRRGGAATDRWSREANRARWALQVAWGHGASFELVEEAFFELAAVAGHGSGAEELWSASLFFALMWGDVDAEWCSARLAMRAQDRDPSRRRLAIAGLRRMIDPNGTVWPKVPNRTSSISGSVAGPARRCALLLLELCADEDAAVRRASVDALAKVFVAAARVQAITPGDDEAARWIALLDEAQRARFAGDVKRWFAESSPQRARWLEMLERRDLVGRVNDALFDRELLLLEHVADALVPLVNELLDAEPDEWQRARASLYVDGAVNAMSFAIALGRADGERRWLPGLLADVDGGRSPDPLSGYLVGRHEAGDDVDALTGTWSDEPRLTARVVSVARMSPNDEQCAWLEDLARRGALSNHSLWALEWGRWEKVSRERALSFVDACLVDPTPKRFSVAATRLDRLVSVAGDDRAVLERCARVMRLAAEGDRWSRSHAYLDPIAEALLAAGEAASVAESLAEMLVEDASGANTVAVTVMRACAERAPEALWAAMSRRFSEFRRRIAVDALLERGFAEWAPSKAVIEWVGDHALRARWVAEWCDVDAAALHPLTRRIIEVHGEDAAVTRSLLDRMTTGARRGSYADALEAAIETLARWAREAPTLAAWCDRASSHLSAERSAQQQPTGT